MPPSTERSTIKVQTERAVLAAVRLPTSVYDQANPFGELRALAEQAGAVVVGEIEQRASKGTAATYMGSGKVKELKALCDALGAQVVIFDHDLSPRQIANIEEVLAAGTKPGEGCKVIDRSELILDIFAARATTHEAKLQVELAQLEYTLPRLRAMWSHLERITGSGAAGGIGTRGPGEQQLEIDRRLAQRKKLDLQHELAGIYARKRRMVQDRRRDHFTVGIVGYTNAGKSTLFNTLTQGGAYADNRLFATLVTRTRDWNLEGGFKVMLSDTVGFVRELPHHLIASFRATLEEATHADVLLIMLDISDPAAELEYRTVIETLDELEEEVRDAEKRDGNLPEQNLDGEGWTPPKRILLLNKADRLKDNRAVLVWKQKVPDAIVISAIQPPPGGLGQEDLRQRILATARQGLIEADITVPISDGKALQRLENRAEVLDRSYDDSGTMVTMRVRIGRRQLDMLRSGSRNLRIHELNGKAPAPGKG
ncbi:MAG TPA: GTPase HflX [Phycisphaerales bacterium]|nr:GTPase HflX [Phycisphaerales bacterium]